MINIYYYNFPIDAEWCLAIKTYQIQIDIFMHNSENKAVTKLNTDVEMHICPVVPTPACL